MDTEWPPSYDTHPSSILVGGQRSWRTRLGRRGGAQSWVAVQGAAQEAAQGAKCRSTVADIGIVPPENLSGSFERKSSLKHRFPLLSGPGPPLDGDSWTFHDRRAKPPEVPAASTRSRPCGGEPSDGSPCVQLDEDIDVHERLKGKLGEPGRKRVTVPAQPVQKVHPPPKATDDGSVRGVFGVPSSISVTNKTKPGETMRNLRNVSNGKNSNSTIEDVSTSNSMSVLTSGTRSFASMEDCTDSFPSSIRDCSQGSGPIAPARAEKGTDPMPTRAELAAAEPKEEPALKGPMRGCPRRRRDQEEGSPRRCRRFGGSPVTRLRVHPSEYQPSLRKPRHRRSAQGCYRYLADDSEDREEPSSKRLTINRKHIEKLSQPNVRYDRRIPRHEPQPNLSVGPEPIWPIPRAALRTLATPRVSRLSMASSRRSTRQDDSQSRSPSMCPVRVISARLVELSRPRQLRLPDDMPSSRRRLTETEWKKHQEWLELNAQPKRDYSLAQAKVRRGRSASLRRLLPRIRVLARPSHRSMAQPDRDIKPVRQSALRYRASERIIQLSRPLQRRLTNP